MLIDKIDENTIDSVKVTVSVETSKEGAYILA